MKKHLLLLAICLASITIVPAQTKDAVSYQVFYDALAPYGKWMYDKTYGYVWSPSEQNFRPYYSEGYWAMTDAGCTWVSNYTWGWAPFHYGRWIYDALYHWLWVPGNKWASAWVVWRMNGDVTGWVPITPGTPVSAAIASTYYVPADWWVFVKRENLLKNNIKSHAEPSKSNNDYVHKTSVNLNKHTGEKEDDTYMSGPKADEFSKSTGQRFMVYSMKNMTKQGKVMISSNELWMYMPAVEGSKTEGQPKKFNNVAQPIGKAAALSQGVPATTTKAKTGTATKAKPKTAAKKK